MVDSITDRLGWIYVTMKKPADWKLPTFFSLVDGTFKKIEARYEESPRRIAFDLSGLDYMDSMLVSLFLHAARLTGEHKGALISSDEHLCDLVRLLGLDRLFDLFVSDKEWEMSL
jgi:anti-anti-sigma regulatory factor